MLPTTPPLPPLDNSQYPTQMDFFNDYASFHPISSAREEFDVYPFPDQTTATEEASHQEQFSTFPDCWEALEQPAPTVDLPATLPAAAGHGKHFCNLFIDWCLTPESPESLLPTNSWATNQQDGYSQPSSSSYRWPEVGQEAQSYYPGSLSQEYSFPSTMAFEPLTVDQTISSGRGLFSLKLRVLECLPIITDPLNYWGESQSGPSTSTFYTVSARVSLSSYNPVDALPQENVFTHHQPGAGPTRTELRSAGRYQPYGRFPVRQSEHRNAEAGPSTLVPPPVPYVGLPTLLPSGGVISETTADAEKAQTTGEDEVPVSNFYCS